MAESSSRQQEQQRGYLWRLDDAMLVSVLARCRLGDHAGVRVCCRRFRSLVDSRSFRVARREAGYVEASYIFVAAETAGGQSTHRKTWVRRDYRWEQLEPIPFPGYCMLGTDGDWAVARDGSGIPKAVCSVRPFGPWRLLPPWPSDDDEPFLDDGFVVTAGVLFVFAPRGYASLRLGTSDVQWEWRRFATPCPVDFEDDVKVAVCGDAVYLATGFGLDLVSYDLGYFRSHDNHRDGNDDAAAAHGGQSEAAAHSSSSSATTWTLNMPSYRAETNIDLIKIEIMLVFRGRVYCLYSTACLYGLAVFDVETRQWLSCFIDELCRSPDSPAHFICDDTHLYLVACAVDQRHGQPVAFQSDGGHRRVGDVAAPPEDDNNNGPSRTADIIINGTNRTLALDPADVDINGNHVALENRLNLELLSDAQHPRGHAWACQWHPVKPPLAPPPDISNFFGCIVRCRPGAS
eukprot:CAMPEP_0198664268 /NCGR_PEP_ID=MMETSP1467-20131203/55517_1 /TAXON_ID=1462469 /ORGANISM="unid. sp., Strain CCMP2135" /LENGTH=460 /DNA_ID=CAMNT_0044400829 /DNA_START=122 /DNA_END=1504 /DNA_ORIENTATION=+